MSLSWLVVLQEEDLQEHGELQGPHDERLRPRNPALTPAAMVSPKLAQN